MRVNDKDIKDMLDKVYDIHTKVEVITEKCDNIEKHLAVQNSKLVRHDTQIQKASNDITDIRARMWVLLLVGGGIGGIIGSATAATVKFAIETLKVV